MINHGLRSTVDNCTSSCKIADPKTPAKAPRKQDNIKPKPNRTVNCMIAELHWNHGTVEMRNSSEEIPSLDKRWACAV